MSEQTYETRLVAAPLARNANDGRPTHVGSEVGTTPELIDTLHGKISELESRLCGVLRQECDEPAKLVSDTVREVLVPLADQLREHNAGISWAGTRLSSILGRLEI